MMAAHQEYWAGHRRLRELLKLQLQADRIGSPDEFLSANQQIPRRAETPAGYEQFENYIPIAVRRAALRANHKARSVQKTRKHRSTGRPRGPKKDDTALARHVHRLMQD